MSAPSVNESAAPVPAETPAIQPSVNGHASRSITPTRAGVAGTALGFGAGWWWPSFLCRQLSSARSVWSVSPVWAGFPASSGGAEARTSHQAISRVGPSPRAPRVRPVHW